MAYYLIRYVGIAIIIAAILPLKLQSVCYFAMLINFACIDRPRLQLTHPRAVVAVIFIGHGDWRIRFNDGIDKVCQLSVTTSVYDRYMLLRFRQARFSCLNVLACQDMFSAAQWWQLQCCLRYCQTEQLFS